MQVKWWVHSTLCKSVLYSHAAGTTHTETQAICLLLNLLSLEHTENHNLANIFDREKLDCRFVTFIIVIY